MKKTTIILSLAAIVMSSLAWSANPLRRQARTIFPENIVTVGEAASYVLAPLGYQLLVDFPAPPESAWIAKLDVPAVIMSRDVIMPIEDMLLGMIGTTNALVVDHEHRLVSFAKHTDAPDADTGANAN